MKSTFNPFSVPGISLNRGNEIKLTNMKAQIIDLWNQGIEVLTNEQNNLISDIELSECSNVDIINESVIKIDGSKFKISSKKIVSPSGFSVYIVEVIDYL